MNKDMNKLMREYRRLGWVITKTGGNHYKWVAPDGRCIFTASTPGDFYNLANVKARLKRRTG